MIKLQAEARARRAGKFDVRKLAGNPFDPGTSTWRAWNDGFTAAVKQHNKEQEKCQKTPTPS